MIESTIQRGDGRTVGFSDQPTVDGTAVLWCHGAPGSRREPLHVTAQAYDAGLRLVGVDRPGYGWSAPQPGRTIADWADDALAVADHLGLARFVAVGTSTGGAYALAAAARASDRVLGVVVCCAMTDMRCTAARATMSRPHAHTVWDAPDRARALLAAIESHGPHGEKLLQGGLAAAIAPSDAELFRTPEWTAAAEAEFPVMFAQGLEGYTDDRIADGSGWSSFEAADIGCPVTVVHGAADRMVDISHAHHTAEVLPHAQLVIWPDLGHFSVLPHIVPAITALLAGETDRPFRH